MTIQQRAREAEQDNICSELDDLVKRQRMLSFTDPTKSTDLEGLGILVSRYTEWDGEGIYLVAYEALTDANYHALAAKLKYLWDHPFVRAEQLCAAEDERIMSLQKEGYNNGNHQETEPTGRQIQQPNAID